MRKLSSTKLIAALNGVGIKMESYKSGLNGKHAVAMAKNASGTALRYWFPENASFEVSTNKRHGQAVLKVTENPRRIPNRIAKTLTAPKDCKSKLSLEECEEKCPHFLREQKWIDPIVFVPSSHFVPSHVTVRRRTNTTFTNTTFATCGVVIHGHSVTQKTTVYFLIGSDEGKHFISVLKKPVNTVEEAHKELRPAGISNDAVRQGEWFFDPVEPQAINKILCNKIYHKRKLETKSSHEADNLVFHKGEKYVFGFVRDTRRGYHKPVKLEGVYRVVRNNEREFKQEPRNYD